MYHQITISEYLSWKEEIGQRLMDATQNFVAIGYMLKRIEGEEAYLQDGYETIYDFAQKEYGLGRSTTSRFMAINTKYSIGGNSKELQDRYKEFSSSALTEMLNMTDQDISLISANSTVKEIREVKQFNRQKEPVRTDWKDFILDMFKGKEETVMELKYAKNEEDVIEAIAPGGHAQHRKGTLLVFFKSSVIQIKEFGKTEIRTISYQEFLEEVKKVFDFYLDNPYKEVYQEEKTSQEEERSVQKQEKMPSGRERLNREKGEKREGKEQERKAEEIKQPCQFATSQETEKKEEKTEIQEAQAEEMMPVMQQEPIVLEEKRSIYMDVAVIQRLHRLLTAEEEQYIRELAGELEEREQR
ncbi:MAG: hypothetical protein ACI4E3_03330 [Candidatus Fimousia sp.]